MVLQTSVTTRPVLQSPLSLQQDHAFDLFYSKLPQHPQKLQTFGNNYSVKLILFILLI